MQKIEKHLSTLAFNNLNKKFDVIVVVQPGTNISEIIAGEHSRLMDEIITTSLTGEQIIMLAKEKNVISIELNAEVFIN